MPRLARPIVALLALALWSVPVLADPQPCTCQNLESLQQEYQNAKYLEGYMQKLAQHLRGVEEKQRGLNTSSNSDPDQGNSIHGASANARDAYARKNLKLPFPQVKDYTGPSVVDMIPGQCNQSAADLKAMEEGSACEAIADATAAHEAAHRNLCQQMGANAYWARLPSEIALEEAEMYKAQALNLKAELWRVLDVSDVRLISEWRDQLAGGGGQMTQLNRTESDDLAPSSGKGDRWTMIGKGRSYSYVETLEGGDGSCRGSQPIPAELSVNMATDGLTFDLEVTETKPGGDSIMTCSNGMTVPMPAMPSTEGVLTRNQNLRVGDNPMTEEDGGIWSMIVSGAAGAGASLSGSPQMVLSVTCEAP